MNSNRSPRTPTNLNHVVPSAAAAPPTAAATSESGPAPQVTAAPSLLGNLPSRSHSPKKPAVPAVPTLIDLLASAKKGKKKLLDAGGTSKPASKGKGKGKAKESTPSLVGNAENGHQQPDVDAGDGVQEKLPAAPFLFPEADVEDEVAAVEKDTEEQESVHANFHDLSNREKDLHPFNPYTNSIAMAYDDPSLIPVDAMSPAKSLSSLAGSDSEDDEIEIDDDGKSLALSFNPLATSTQQQRGPFVSSALRNEFSSTRISGVKESQPPPNFSQMTKDSWESIYAPTSMPKSKSKSKSSSAKSKSPAPQPRHYQLPNTDPIPSSNPFAYSSQFASGVAKSVYDVDRLLEQDVELAYSGWIRDPYADEIEDADGFKDPESSP